MGERVTVIHVDHGTPVRLGDVDCPACGWADIRQVPLLRLAPTGVTTVGMARRCARCRHRGC